jgi:hypothetical protein
MITLAVDERAVDFFKGPVAEYFYVRTGERLRVVQGTSKPRNADFMVVPESSLRTPGQIKDAARSLNRFKAFLANCGGFSGPFAFDGGDALGIRLDVFVSDDEKPPELPERLDFLTQPDKLVLAAVTDRGLKRRGDQGFYHLTLLTQSIAHELPFVPSIHVQHTLTVGEKLVVAPRTDRVKGRKISFDSKSKHAVFELTAVNTTDELIPGLEAYFFDVPVRAFGNAHGQAQFRSRVNRVGPVPGFRFGDLAPGDSITRRIQYDTSFGGSLKVAWTPRLAMMMDNAGRGFGNGCTTKKPEPIPDEIALGVETGCFDAGCKIGGT